jgi:hypothetical protein
MNENNGPNSSNALLRKLQHQLEQLSNQVALDKQNDAISLSTIDIEAETATIRNLISENISTKNLTFDNYIWPYKPLPFIHWNGHLYIKIAMLGDATIEDFVPTVAVSGELRTTEVEQVIPYDTPVDVTGVVRGHGWLNEKHDEYVGQVWVGSSDREFSFLTNFTKGSLSATYYRNDPVSQNIIGLAVLYSEGNYYLALETTGVGDVTLFGRAFGATFVPSIVDSAYDIKASVSFLGNSGNSISDFSTQDLFVEDLHVGTLFPLNDDIKIEVSGVIGTIPTKEYGDSTYVSANTQYGIDAIQDSRIDNIEATIPTLSVKTDQAYTDAVQDERLSNLEQLAVAGLHYKGEVATKDALPAGASVGDMYLVNDDGTGNSVFAVWDGTEYDFTETNLDIYLKKPELSNAVYLVNGTSQEADVVFDHAYLDPLVNTATTNTYARTDGSMQEVEFLTLAQFQQMYLDNTFVDNTTYFVLNDDPNVPTIGNHDQLANRELPNQHPISAITNLTETLANIKPDAIIYDNIPIGTDPNTPTYNKHALLQAITIHEDTATEVQVNAWSIDVTNGDVLQDTISLPMATSASAGIMSGTDKAKLDSMTGQGYIIAGNNFGHTLNLSIPSDVTLLSNWAISQIPDASTTDDIPAFTVLKNFFDDTEYIWNKTTGLWVFNGSANVSTATNESLGVVMGTTSDYTTPSIGINTDGTMVPQNVVASTSLNNPSNGAQATITNSNAEIVATTYTPAITAGVNSQTELKVDQLDAYDISRSTRQIGSGPFALQQELTLDGNGLTVINGPDTLAFNNGILSINGKDVENADIAYTYEITNQATFDAWRNNVAGNDYTNIFIKASDTPYQLSNIPLGTLQQYTNGIDCTVTGTRTINSDNAIISASGQGYFNVLYGFSATNDAVSISNLQIIVGAGNNFNVVTNSNNVKNVKVQITIGTPSFLATNAAFNGVNNLQDCTVNATTYNGYGSCSHLYRCKLANTSTQLASVQAFYDCNYLYDCYSSLNNGSNNPAAFFNCDILFGCVSKGSNYGFASSSNLNGCEAYYGTKATAGQVSAVGFYESERLTDCTAEIFAKSAVGYDSCSYITNCYAQVYGYSTDANNAIGEGYANGTSINSSYAYAGAQNISTPASVIDVGFFNSTKLVGNTSRKDSASSTYHKGYQGCSYMQSNGSELSNYIETVTTSTVMDTGQPGPTADGGFNSVQGA